MSPRKLSRRAKKMKVIEYIDRYRTKFRLFDWTIGHTIYKTLDEIPEGEERSAAGCTASSEYRQGRIYFVLDELSDEELEGTVAHELIHCILWPMTHHMDRWAGADAERIEIARYSLEEVTTLLDRIFLGMETGEGKGVSNV